MSLIWRLDVCLDEVIKNCTNIVYIECNTLQINFKGIAMIMVLNKPKRRKANKHHGFFNSDVI